MVNELHKKAWHRIFQTEIYFFLSPWASITKLDRYFHPLAQLSIQTVAINIKCNTAVGKVPTELGTKGLRPEAFATKIYERCKEICGQKRKRGPTISRNRWHCIFTCTYIIYVESVRSCAKMITRAVLATLNFRENIFYAF